jgi:leucyl-tRNA synthetase
MSEAYPFREVEAKWRKRWEDADVYHTPDPPRNKFYLLEMYPYPSGDMHAGHLKNYTFGDAMARYYGARGYDLLHPMGFDSFGLPAEECAINRSLDPKEWTERNIAETRETMRRLGITYDWSRELATHTPEYYRWTQWMFLRLFERGLAYQAESLVNWCPDCKTVLANEQVIGGNCWRHEDTPVTKRSLKQWFFRITDYAERLLEGIESLTEWPESVRVMQRNWIGRSEGTEVVFDLDDGSESFTVFTTRPDTLYGATFLCMAPEHPAALRLAQSAGRKPQVEAYVTQAMAQTDVDRLSSVREKDGVFTGRYVVNPASGERMPVWVADYVLMTYGTGVVMAVPGHDQRDFEFARAFDLPISVVITPPDGVTDPDALEAAYEGEGAMVNSGPFDGVWSMDGVTNITEYLEENEKGKTAVAYRLRDWLISRQRFWGAPIPIVHCEKCGAVPVPDEELPVLLPPPSEVDFVPKGRSPLAAHSGFSKTICPKCGGDAVRDPDTMDTFVDSSWYHLRFTDADNDEEPFSKEAVDRWLPVDLYIGGAEHNTGHLIYFRFFTKVLHDMGYLSVDEPCVRLINHGMVMDEHGDVLSKSKGNARPIGELLGEHGSDVYRLAILFAGPPEKETRWSEHGVAGVKRFADRVWRLYRDGAPEGEAYDTDLQRALHRAIRGVTEDLERTGLNTAISKMMVLVNEMTARAEEDKYGPVYRECLRTLPVMLAPFAPHLAAETAERVGESTDALYPPWPEYDPELAAYEVVTYAVQVNGKRRGEIQVAPDAQEDEIEKTAREEQNVARHLTGKQIVRAVVVPDRLVNFVVR